jgi:hypothetical protein
MPQRWSPQDVLQLSNDNRCIGDAPSKRRKCLRVVNSGDMRVFNYMLKDLAEEYPDADIMKSKLERLAHLGLCVAINKKTMWCGSGLQEYARRFRRRKKRKRTTTRFRGAGLGQRCRGNRVPWELRPQAMLLSSRRCKRPLRRCRKLFGLHSGD